MIERAKGACVSSACGSLHTAENLWSERDGNGAYLDLLEPEFQTASGGSSLCRGVRGGDRDMLQFA